VPAGDARISDADRESTVVRLREAHVDGALTLEEFTDRIELAHRARTVRELARATDQLPPAPPVSRKRPKRGLLAIFAGRTLSGRWRARRRLTVVSLFGGYNVDLRETTLDPDGLTIYSLAFFAGNDFFIPEGIEVDLRALAIVGSANERGSEGSIELGSPLIRVVALSLFGSNDVRHVPASTGKSLRQLKLQLKLAALGDFLRIRARG
jgi:hypothetical protein